jgi:hypothetical protein
MKEIKTFNFKLKEMESFECTEDRVVEPQGRWSTRNGENYNMSSVPSA